jgi:Tetracyclin repressor-like, C-terminal domain
VTFEAVPRALLASGVARGELAPNGDQEVLLDAFIGAIHHRIFMMNERVTDDFLSRLADILLLGALLPAAREVRSRAPLGAGKARARVNGSSRSSS